MSTLRYLSAHDKLKVIDPQLNERPSSFLPPIKNNTAD